MNMLSNNRKYILKNGFGLFQKNIIDKNFLLGNTSYKSILENDNIVKLIPQKEDVFVHNSFLPFIKIYFINYNEIKINYSLAPSVKIIFLLIETFLIFLEILLLFIMEKNMIFFLILAFLPMLCIFIYLVLDIGLKIYIKKFEKLAIQNTGDGSVCE